MFFSLTVKMGKNGKTEPTFLSCSENSKMKKLEKLNCLGRDGMVMCDVDVFMGTAQVWL